MELSSTKIMMSSSLLKNCSQPVVTWAKSGHGDSGTALKVKAGVVGKEVAVDVAEINGLQPSDIFDGISKRRQKRCFSTFKWPFHFHIFRNCRLALATSPPPFEPYGLSGSQGVEDVGDICEALLYLNPNLSPMLKPLRVPVEYM